MDDEDFLDHIHFQHHHTHHSHNTDHSLPSHAALTDYQYSYLQDEEYQQPFSDEQKNVFVSPSVSTWLNLSTSVLLNSSWPNEGAEFEDSSSSPVNGTMSPDDAMYDSEIPEGGYSILHSLPLWRKLIWVALFGMMVIVASVGNITVIWIVLAHKRMRTVTNYLLVNLSIADAMVSTLNVIPNFIFMLTSHWPFGQFYCKLVQFVAILSICGSVFSLMAIAFDRYTAIMNPLRPRMGKRLTLGIAMMIWVLGIILGAPHFIFCTTYETAISESETVVFCYAEWPDGPQTESYQEYLYNVFFMIFTYFVPIAAMCYTYTRVGIELWGSKSIGECTQRQLDNIKSKRRVVKMMIVVVIIFAFCWLPFHIYFIWVSVWPDVTRQFFVREVYLGIYWLAMSNSMYNPMIYCWMNARFRRGFQQVFRWCPFVHYNEVEGPTGHVLHHADTRRFRGGMDTTRYSVTGSPENEVHTRVTRNGTSTVHIPLHVLTSSDGPNNKKGTCGGGSGGGGNHFLSPNGFNHVNKSSQRSKSNSNKNTNNEFM